MLGGLANRRFWFGVRCRFGRWFGVVFTGSLVSFCFLVVLLRFVVPLFERGSVAGACVAASILSVCYSLLMVAFIRTCSTHPGRVPHFFDEDEMNKRVDSLFVEQCTHMNLPDDTVTDLRTRFRVGMTAVALVSSMRYCESCALYKCQTTHHCSSCGTCVFEMDHHCPWVGICIGRDNHKYFILFLFYTMISSVVVAAMCATSAISNSGIADTLLFFAWMICCVFTLILAPFLFTSVQTVHHNTSTIARLQLKRGPRTGAGSRPAYRVVNNQTTVVDTATSASSSVVDVAPDEDARLSPLRVGLARIMGSSNMIPWWFLPVAPCLHNPEAEWTNQLATEVEDSIHMCFAYQANAEQLRREAGAGTRFL